jgi:hypothetical protein
MLGSTDPVWCQDHLRESKSTRFELESQIEVGLKWNDIFKNYLRIQLTLEGCTRIK